MVNIEGEDARSRRPGGVARDENCRYTTVRKYHCSTHRDADADAPVQKCEKTVQVLKHCVGRCVRVLVLVLVCVCFPSVRSCLPSKPACAALRWS